MISIFVSPFGFYFNAIIAHIIGAFNDVDPFFCASYCALDRSQYVFGYIANSRSEHRGGFAGVELQSRFIVLFVKIIIGIEAETNEHRMRDRRTHSHIECGCEFIFR